MNQSGGDDEPTFRLAAKAAKITDERFEIRLKYFLRIKNVGDRIGPDLLDTVFGLGTRHYSGVTEPHLLAVGSIISGANMQSHVWGTGLMHPAHGVGAALPHHIYALRGKLTFAALRNAGVPLADIPLGDPAYLVRDLPLSFQRSKKYRLGLVPHYVDRGNPTLVSLQKDDDVAFLDVRDDPDVFLQKMAECETIASSSLHGLILAEALNIPNVWLHLSDAVAGEGFKFHDWFSMTEMPQNVPFVPKEGDSVSDFVKRSSIHQCNVDCNALVASFPRDQFASLSSNAKNGRYTLTQCRKSPPIPIFIISYNRACYLKNMVSFYLGLSSRVRIVIHDNGSDDRSTCELLASYSSCENISVVRSNKISVPDELNLINTTIDDFFSDWAEPSRYIVTDCDIDLSTADANAIAVYGELLDQFRDVECVGPMLTIRDIPVDYPLRNEVFNQHVEQYWHKRPEWTNVFGRRVAVLRAPVGTGFGLHRAGEAFCRTKRGLRVYWPYEARHLDWYRFAEGPYATSSSPHISQWSNEDFLNKHRYASLRFNSFTCVEADGSGQPVEKTESIIS